MYLIKTNLNTIKKNILIFGTNKLDVEKLFITEYIVILSILIYHLKKYKLF